MIIVLSVVLIINSRLKSVKTKLSLVETQAQAYPLFIEELQISLANQQESLNAMNDAHSLKMTEYEQVSKQLNHRVKVVQEELAKVKDMIELYQEQQPEDKLYSRAYKLAELGAGLEEIMSECDLPQAEAEMLLSVYKKKIR